MVQQKTFNKGDLVEVIFQEGTRQWTLCARHIGPRTLDECLAFDENVDNGPHSVYACMKGKLGVITNIVLNKLDQPLLYEINFSNEIFYCKSILAHKYLRKL